MADPATYNDIVKAIDDNKNVFTVKMWQLRDAHEAGRLGKHVVQGISEELADRGIGHVPTSLEQDQWASARLFKRKSAIGRLLAAVETFDDASDNVLRALSDEKADATLQRVRELVCE